MEEMIKYIKSVAKNYYDYSNSKKKLIKATNELSKSVLKEIFEEYCGNPDAKFKPINLLRGEIAQHILQGETLTTKFIDEIKLKIVEGDIEYFASYSEQFLGQLKEFKMPKRDIFTNWRKNWSILYPFFFRGEVKNLVATYLLEIANNLIQQLNLDECSFHYVDFQGSTNFGSDICWIAIYHKNLGSHKNSFQLFLKIATTISCSIIAGDNLKKSLKKRGELFSDDYLKQVKTYSGVLSVLKEMIPQFLELNRKILSSKLALNVDDSLHYKKNDNSEENIFSEKENNISSKEKNIFSEKENNIHSKEKNSFLDKINSENETNKEENSFDKNNEYDLENSFDDDLSYLYKTIDVNNMEEFSQTEDFENLQNFNIYENIEPYSFEKDKDTIFIDEKLFFQITSILKRRKNIVLQGAPGVGKTFIARKIAYQTIGFKNSENIEIVQFHQSFGYEEFIQGLRPDEKGNFFIKNGIFLEFCRKAVENPDQTFVFIIDEINRGNLSKIFGELLMLIEADKRNEEFSLRLAYSNELFFIPENIYIIGTMNRSDRSLAIVDYAFRRRFSFITLQPNFGEKFKKTLEKSGLTTKIVNHIEKTFTKLNKKIKDDISLGEDFQIGHSFFCSFEKNMSEIEWFNDTLLFEIKPLLEEIWFDEPTKVEEIFKNLEFK